MNNTQRKELVWKDEYNIVEEIDQQHKRLFGIINDLIGVINATPKEETIREIITKIVEYKADHFATEEKYFHQFNYEGTNEHENAHQRFNSKVKELQDMYGADAVTFAFNLVDFLEDWLIAHLMNMDQKYKKCFNDHGLF